MLQQRERTFWHSFSSSELHIQQHVMVVLRELCFDDGVELSGVSASPPSVYVHDQTAYLFHPPALSTCLLTSFSRDI